MNDKKENENETEYNPVARLRERFYEIKRNIKPSKELLDSVKRKPVDKSSGRTVKKVAKNPHDPEVDLP